MAHQTLSYSTLKAGAIDPSVLTYEPVSIGALGPPVLDAACPEMYNEPNYDANLFYSALNEAVGSAFDDVVKVVTVASPAGESIETKSFVFHNADLVTAVRLVDDHGNYERWLDALGQPFKHGSILFSFHRRGHRSGPAINLDILATDPASWIKKQAPSAWPARAQAPTKQSIIAAALKVASPPVATDPELIGSLWSELVEVAGFVPNLGATADDLAAFRQASGFELPEGLAALLSLSNGATDAFGFRSLMSIAEITRQWVEWKTIFDDFPLDDLQDNYRSDQDRTIAMYTTPHWVSFADEGSGNYAAVDLLPGPAGRQGQIIYFGADQSQVRWIASDVADFLSRAIGAARGDEVETNWF